MVVLFIERRFSGRGRICGLEAGISIAFGKKNRSSDLTSPFIAINPTASVSSDLMRLIIFNLQGLSSWVRETEHHFEAQLSMQVGQSLNGDYRIEKGLRGATTKRVPRLEVGSCGCSGCY